MKEKKALLNHDEIRDTEKMALIGEMAASIAHEIKNPLAAISGALQVLAEDFPADSPRRDIIQEILTEIERLDASVRELLFLARPPALHILPTDINALVERAVHSFRRHVAGQDVKVETSLKAACDVMIDPEQMEIALYNIFLYCLYSISHRGRVVTSTHGETDSGETEITVFAEGRDKLLRNAHTLSDIFRPFFSVKKSDAGLGLAISRNIVERHGGTISPETRNGTGILFHIRLGNTR